MSKHAYKADVTFHGHDGIDTCNYHPLSGLGDDWESIKEDIYEYFNPDVVSKVHLYRSDGEERVFNMETKEYEK